ncbi:serine hydrolase domain-containing protein [Alteromonas lipotrueiana]|uniref:serine hydrolase domain-containing protein n=1 Tax=Alteromonas lipotrueiana TaxID=2803815 RepID=UPI001C46E7E3|nr:serine hydrolase domain-containing protein [Alteromonas lipotrueiana]
MKILIVLLCLAIAHKSFALEGEQSNPLRDTEVSKLMRERDIPGLAIAKINNATLSFMGVYGYADVANNIKVTKETMFNVASISKPIMGVTLLQLVDKKLLSLDANINDYLPFKIDNPYFTDGAISLRNLATHTSSIADYYQPDSFSKNNDSPISLEQHVKSLLVKGGSNYQSEKYYLNHTPGEERKYSNLAAGVAGLLIESVIGVPLFDYSEQTLFQSLKMNDTAWLLNGLDFRKLATPYSISDTQKFLPHAHIGNPQYPDGGVRSSIQDLTKLMIGILKNKDTDGNKLLSNSSYAEMLTLQLPPDISKSQRFFWIDNKMGLTGHMGSDIGTFCAFYFDPTSRDGIIILMNVDMNDDSIQAMQTLAQYLMSYK